MHRVSPGESSILRSSTARLRSEPSVEQYQVWIFEEVYQSISFPQAGVQCII